MTQRNETNFGKMPNCKVHKIVELQEHNRSVLLQEAAKKVPTKKLVWGIEDI